MKFLYRERFLALVSLCRFTHLNFTGRRPAVPQHRRSFVPAPLTQRRVIMNRLLLATVALVTVFSLPASAVSAFPVPAPAPLMGPGSAPRFRDIPDVPRNAEANRQQQSTET